MALVVSACASANVPAGSSTQSRVDIEINNNLIPPGPVYIYLIPDGGIERDLGTVFTGTHTVSYTGLELKGNYQLVAKTGDRTVPSAILPMKNVLGLRWDLERNYIEVTKVAE